MKSYVKVLFLLGLVALMMPLLLGYAIGPIGASHTNTIGTHADSKSLDNLTCNNCHNRLASNESQDNTYLAAPRRHFLTAFLNFTDSTDPSTSDGCGDCHEETIYGGNEYRENASGNGDGLGSGYEGDLSYTDTDTPNSADFARAAMKQVKPDVCETCHGSFNTAAHDSNDYATDAPTGCQDTCHDGGNGEDPGNMHDSIDYINTRYAESTVFCVRCHGELALYLTAETTPAAGLP